MKILFVLFLSVLSLKSFACNVEMGIHDLKEMMVSVESELGVLSHADKKDFYSEAKSLLKNNDITDEDMTGETMLSVGLYGGDLFFETGIIKGIFTLFVLETLGEGACASH